MRGWGKNMNFKFNIHPCIFKIIQVSYSDEEAVGSNASASSSPFKPLPESDEDEKKMIEKIRKKRAKLIAKIPSLPESVEIKTVR